MSHSGLEQYWICLLTSFSNIHKYRQHFGKWISFHPEIRKVGKTWVPVTELFAVQLFAQSTFLNVLISPNLHSYVDNCSVGIIPTADFNTCVRFEVLPFVFMVIHVPGIWRGWYIVPTFRSCVLPASGSEQCPRVIITYILYSRQNSRLTAWPSEVGSTVNSGFRRGLVASMAESRWFLAGTVYICGRFCRSV
jgi:hypothetical protein